MTVTGKIGHVATYEEAEYTGDTFTWYSLVDDDNNHAMVINVRPEFATGSIGDTATFLGVYRVASMDGPDWYAAASMEIVPTT